MWSLSLAMSECSLCGRGQGHVSNFYIVHLENFATAIVGIQLISTTRSVVGLFVTPIRQWKRLDRVVVECTCLLHISLHCNPPLHNFNLFRTCRTSSSCTVAWQLARFQLTRRIARSLSDSWASYFNVAVVSASDCGVTERGPRLEYHRGQLCLWRRPLRYAALGMGYTPNCLACCCKTN